MPNVLVVDLDNTLMDTAQRKLSILQTMTLPSDRPLTLEAVKNDFNLNNWLGEPDSESRISFIANLQSEGGIKDHTAPPFTGAISTIQEMSKLGVKVAIISARPERLLNATIEELRNAQLSTDDVYLHLMPSANTDRLPSEEKERDFKTTQLLRLATDAFSIVYIGDRPVDVLAARDARVKPILFHSTTSPCDINVLRKGGPLQVCKTWWEIALAVEHSFAEDEKLVEFRDFLTSQFSGWLSDIDNKCRVIATLAAAVSAAAGSLLIHLLPSGNSTDSTVPLIPFILSAIALLSAVIAMIYAIQAVTSRSTKTRAPMRTRLRQWLFILIGWPKRWCSLPNDSIQQLETLLAQAARDQACAHTKHFQRRHETTSAQALLNIRFFEMRALNYAKLYPERLASRLLQWSIAILVSAIVAFASHQFASHSTSDRSSPANTNAVPIKGTDNASSKVAQP